MCGSDFAGFSHVKPGFMQQQSHSAFSLVLTTLTLLATQVSCLDVEKTIKKRSFLFFLVDNFDDLSTKDPAENGDLD